MTMLPNTGAVVKPIAAGPLRKKRSVGVSKDATSGALQANPFGTGKTGYGAAGAAPSATTGPVDKQGYRDREVRRRAAAKIRKAR